MFLKVIFRDATIPLGQDPRQPTPEERQHRHEKFLQTLQKFDGRIKRQLSSFETGPDQSGFLISIDREKEPPLRAALNSEIHRGITIMPFVSMSEFVAEHALDRA